MAKDFMRKTPHSSAILRGVDLKVTWAETFSTQAATEKTHMGKRAGKVTNLWPTWQVTLDYLACVDFDEGFMALIFGVKMGRRVMPKKQGMIDMSMA